MSSNLNMNKAAAAILVAGLIGMVTGKVTEFLYLGGPVEPGQHSEEKRGYKIDVVEDTSGGDAGAAPAGAGDLSALYATADVAAGEKYVETKCTTCHDVSKGGSNKVGPHLWGVVNRATASISDFNYSSAMKKHAEESKSWTPDALNAFLWAPGKTVPGTMMSFAGISKDQDRANVIAYISTKMTDSPAKLPTASAKPAGKDAKSDAKGAPAKGAKGDTGKAAADAKTGAKLDAGTAPNPNAAKKDAPAPASGGTKESESKAPAAK